MKLGGGKAIFVSHYPYRDRWAIAQHLQGGSADLAGLAIHAFLLGCPLAGAHDLMDSLSAHAILASNFGSSTEATLPYLFLDD